MSRIRTLFLGTPEIARFCLESMIKDEHFEIVGVVTQPDRPAGRKMQLQPSPVKALVQASGIPILTPEDINQDEVLNQIQALTAEVAVVVAYGQILKNKFLDLYPKRVVNVHASILPKWRGAAPIQRSLMNGDKENGVTLQLVVRKLDAGPVLGIRRFAQPSEMNAFESYEICTKLGASLLEVDLMDYLRGNLSAIPQDESQVTYAAKIDKSEAEIDWNKSAEQIHNLVRGLAMGPTAYSTLGGRTLKLHRTRVVTNAATKSKSPGQILAAAGQSLLVQCGVGSLELLEVQPESRSKVHVSEFLRGHSVQPGDSFGAKIQPTK